MIPAEKKTFTTTLSHTHTWKRSSENSPLGFKATCGWDCKEKLMSDDCVKQRHKLWTFWPSGGQISFFWCRALLQLKLFQERMRFLKRFLTTASASASRASQLLSSSGKRRCFLLLKNESLFLPLTCMFVYSRWSVASPFLSFIPHLQHVCSSLGGLSSSYCCAMGIKKITRCLHWFVLQTF